MVRVGVIRELNGNQHATYVIQLVIFVLEVSLAPSQQTFTGLVQVGLYRLPNGDHTNVYGHVAVMHGHLCRTLCRVSAKGTRFGRLFLRPALSMLRVLCNLYFLFSRFDAPDFCSPVDDTWFN